MNFGEKAYGFYSSLKPPASPAGSQISVMDPFNDKQVMNILGSFYRKFYADNRERIFLIGINPGRFGGGITGIPFTDPVNLAEILRISSTLDKRHELSSRFIYEVVKRIGGPGAFFGKCYMTALSPFGFTRYNRNLNYYDDRDLYRKWEPLLADWMQQQIGFGAFRDVAFSLGRGKNFEHLERMNAKHGFFGRIEALPHPRWVMQYRYKKRHHFFNFYIERINSLKVY